MKMIAVAILLIVSTATTFVDGQRSGDDTPHEMVTKALLQCLQQETGACPGLKADGGVNRENVKCLCNEILCHRDKDSDKLLNTCVQKNIEEIGIDFEGDMIDLYAIARRVEIRRNILKWRPGEDSEIAILCLAINKKAEWSC